ncbi:MAG: hypothetical protein L0Y58_05680 [Verrucomicrobia subdivision 3 bacterium]|nr:hypothetical protein [Limisphaerales bacterium]
MGYLDQWIDHHRGDTRAKLIARIWIDTILQKQPWVEFKTRDVLAIRCNCNREELNRAIASVCQDGDGYLHLEERDGRLRFSLKPDSKAWKTTPKYSEAIRANAETGSTSIEDETPALPGLPAYLFADELNEELLRAAIDAVACDEPSDSPTVSTRNRNTAKPVSSPGPSETPTADASTDLDPAAPSDSPTVSKSDRPLVKPLTGETVIPQWKQAFAAIRAGDFQKAEAIAASAASDCPTPLIDIDTSTKSIDRSMEVESIEDRLKRFLKAVGQGNECAEDSTAWIGGKFRGEAFLGWKDFLNAGVVESELPRVARLRKEGVAKQNWAAVLRTYCKTALTLRDE